MTIQAVFKVSAGKQNVFLKASGDDVSVINPRLTLLYVPTAYGIIDADK